LQALKDNGGGAMIFLKQFRQLPFKSGSPSS
jgi:hypothetical protein